MIGTSLMLRASNQCGWARVHARVNGQTVTSTKWSERACVGGVMAVALAVYATPAGLALVPVCAFVLLKARRARRRSARVALISRAGAYAEAGNLDVAAQLLANVARDNDVVASYARAALAITYLRQGKSGVAVWLLASVIEERGCRCNAAGHALAYAYAVAGALNQATCRRLGVVQLRRLRTPLAYLMLCKRRNFAKVAAMAARRTECSTPACCAHIPMGGHGERVVALLCAFALHRQHSLVPASIRRMHQLLDVARPTYAGEYDYLTQRYRELGAFVDDCAGELDNKTSMQLVVAIPSAHVVGERRRPRPAGQLAHMQEQR